MVTFTINKKPSFVSIWIPDIWIRGLGASCCSSHVASWSQLEPEPEIPRPHDHEDKSKHSEIRLPKTEVKQVNTGTIIWSLE